MIQLILEHFLFSFLIHYIMEVIKDLDFIFFRTLLWNQSTFSFFWINYCKVLKNIITFIQKYYSICLFFYLGLSE